MVVEVEDKDEDEEFARLNEAFLVIVVDAVEEDLAAVNCGNGFTSVIFAPSTNWALRAKTDYVNSY